MKRHVILKYFHLKLIYSKEKDEKNKTLFILLLLLVTVNFGKYTFISSASSVAPTSLLGENDNKNI